ncbi:MAG: hypothetical protein KAY24_04395 [Candidatus Eisenbacteria sp.]|nr:hypothetical protein [Candidatus Eisenbacteria bacterium]
MNGLRCGCGTFGWIPHGFLAALIGLVLLASWGAGCRGEHTGQSDERHHATRRPLAAAGQEIGSDRNGARSGGSGGGENKSPKARFETLPVAGWANLTIFTLDASLSSDDRDLSGQLKKRWDFDGDGTWDMPFTRRVRTHHVYEQAGEVRPKLLIRDLGGMEDIFVGERILIRPACPPPDFSMVDANPNSLSFGQTCRLSEQRGRRVLLWYASPST